jgi:NADH:ubiquinone oxidoreductase subunit 5 (subunit L)/multisubunit Na+/H+ antiporter MnhA subunit
VLRLSLDDEQLLQNWRGQGALDLIDSHLVFCIDSLALVAASLVLLLTSFALYFGVEYMYREAFINRLLYLLNLFATSVIFLFFCYDFFLILFA